jgi:hypothetical protein
MTDHTKNPTLGILDGEFLVTVIAWGCSGSADTIILHEGRIIRVNHCRVW